MQEPPWIHSVLKTLLFDSDIMYQTLLPKKYKHEINKCPVQLDKLRPVEGIANLVCSRYKKISITMHDKKQKSDEETKQFIISYLKNEKR